jgi:glycosyltransferase involved in cell wall biosynthesis
MRLVIDGQILQSTGLDEVTRGEIRTLVRELSDTPPGMEFFLVMNGDLPDRIETIRSEFAAFLPPASIRLWYGPKGRRESWQDGSAALIRQILLASLDPDLVFVPIALGTHAGEYVFSIDPTAKFPTVVHAVLDAGSQTPVTGIIGDQIARARLTTVRQDRDVATLSASLPEVPIVTFTSSRNLREILAQATVSLRGRVTSRPRLAYVSPLPPEKSGISFYSSELLPALSAHYDVELIVANWTTWAAWRSGSYRVRSIRSFMRGAKRYDRILYHFGNSHFHKHMFALLRQYPGVVVLHDFYLSGVASTMERSGYSPGFWFEELYRAHGYRAASERFLVKEQVDVMWHYPCSGRVIEDATGVIVHSRNSEELLRRWNGESAARKTALIPHLRAPAAIDRSADARQSLGFAADDFIICSYGFLGPTKLNHRLLECWLASRLASDPRCKLVFVGANNEGPYGRGLLRTIAESGHASRITITGWSNEGDFQKLLEIADLAVQLRTLSRGETSGTVLDCMKHGVPLIVNAHGSMAELPDETIWRLEDSFADRDLIDALETLADDAERRFQLAQKALANIGQNHAPAEIASRYAEAIEAFSAKPRNSVPRLVATLVGQMQRRRNTEAIEAVASALALSLPSAPAARQLFIDISAIVLSDLHTGIQRVTRALLRQLIACPPEGFRIEPVYAKGTTFFYARRYTLDFLGVRSRLLQDEPAEFRPGDIYFMPDLHHPNVIANRETYRAMRRHGVSVNFLVHDLLPVRLPQFFPPDAESMHFEWLKVVAEADCVICPSRDVADDLSRWLSENAGVHAKRMRIAVSHHGADIASSNPTKGLGWKASSILEKISKNFAFLMVGTVEPRKGHADVLDAFERLWARGQTDILVIAGKPGWMNDQLMRRLRKHPERNRRLFWVEKASDEYLDRLYSACGCMIIASHGEGFGLPLIEAASKGLPIIAREIPVFREIAGDHAFFFDAASSGDELADSILTWRGLHQQQRAPDSSRIQYLTWEESAENLKALLVAERMQNDAETAAAE